MNKKGTILIVDDRIEEKIGTFRQYLDIEGFNVEIAEDLKKADKLLSDLIKSNKLDGLILDLSFPVSKEDPSVTTEENIPCGVSLFRKHEFKLRNKMIPIVLNSTADEEFKRKYFGNIEKSNTLMYNVDVQSNPLTRPTGNLIKEIIGMFNKRSEDRNLANSIKADNSLRTGKAIVQGQDGKYHYSRYDGD